MACFTYIIHILFCLSYFLLQKSLQLLCLEWSLEADQINILISIHVYRLLIVVGNLLCRLLCDLSSISINYISENNYFTIEFSRMDRNIMPDSDTINGTINGTITDLENNILKEMKSNKNITVKELSIVTNKSIRSINRAILSLKNKKIIERVGPNKTGYWKTLI